MQQRIPQVLNESGWSYHPEGKDGWLTTPPGWDDLEKGKAYFHGGPKDGKTMIYQMTMTEDGWRPAGGGVMYCVTETLDGRFYTRRGQYLSVGSVDQDIWKFQWEWLDEPLKSEEG